jgi:hypothetical protein
LELEAALQLAHRFVAVCFTFGSASIRANERSAADSPSWNWLQNEATLIIGHQKKPTDCMNRYHSPALMPPVSPAKKESGASPCRRQR